MKPFAILTAFLTVTLLVAGCSKTETVVKDEDKPKDKWVVSSGKKGAAESKGDPLKAGDGVITGRVVFKGNKPVMALIPALSSHTDAAACCLKGSESEKVQQQWMFGKDDGVANVVVFLKPPSGKYFEPNEADKNRKDKVYLKQPHCAFVPHIVATYASYWDGKEYKPSGETFIVENNADCKHNTNWQGDARFNNAGGNPSLTPHEEVTLKIHPQPAPIKVTCDIHPWMSASIWAFDSPYFAVTDKDGNFTIKNVPTGVDLSVVGWHEVASPDPYFNGGKNGKMQQFKSGENKIDLTISQ
jgi:hypothetical protein